MTYRIPTRELRFWRDHDDWQEERREKLLEAVRERIEHLCWLVERLRDDKQHLRQVIIKLMDKERR